MKSRIILLVSLFVFLTNLGFASDLSSTKEKTRFKAVKKASKNPKYSQINELITLATKDKNPKIRLYAVIAIRKLKTLKALYPLQKIIKTDKNIKICEAASLALTEIPRQKGYRFLEYAASLNSYPTHIRICALKALAIKLGKNIRLMINLLLRDRNYDIRLAAARVLKRTVHKDNIVYMNMILRRGQTVEIKKHIVRAMLILKSRHNLWTAVNTYKRTKDKELKKLLYKLIKTLDKKKAEQLKS